MFLLLTASHSSLSSPSGSLTAFLKLPLPSVASAYCLSCQLLVPRPDFCGLKGARVRGLLKKDESKLVPAKIAIVVRYLHLCPCMRANDAAGV
jgi:hypothetical protein